MDNVCVEKNSIKSNTTLTTNQIPFKSQLCVSGYANALGLCEDLLSTGTAAAPIACTSTGSSCMYTTSVTNVTLNTPTCGCTPLGSGICSLGTDSKEYAALIAAQKALGNAGCSYYHKSNQCKITSSSTGLFGLFTYFQSSAAYAYPGVNLTSLACMMPGVQDVNPDSTKVNTNMVIPTPPVTTPTAGNSTGNSIKIAFGGLSLALIFSLF